MESWIRLKLNCFVNLLTDKRVKIYLSCGSNLGDRLTNMSFAVSELRKCVNTNLTKVSGLFETEPWGVKDQPYFLNCAMELSTSLKPHHFLGILQSIEALAGRKYNAGKWTERELDLDILLYGSQIIDTVELKIPHPLLTKRRFVLEPLAQLYPEVIIPGKNISVYHALDSCNDESEVTEIKREWLN